MITWPSTLLLWVLLSFVLSCVLVPVCAYLAPRFSLMDVAHGRKQHSMATPVVGGVAVIVVFAVVAIVAELVVTKHPTFWIGTFVLLLVGVLDDIYEFGSRRKFIFQIAVAILMTAWGGVALAHLGDLFGAGAVWLGSWAIPFTVFGVVGIVNAINMIDGIDGLSGLLSLNTLLALLVVMLLGDRYSDALLLALLVGSVAGFLVYNLRSPWRVRASVFMGDAGTLALGFVIAWYIVEVTKDASPLMPPPLAPWLLAVPLWDAAIVMTRRLVHGKSPFRGDRTHLHHLLLELGMTQGLVAVVIAMMAVIITMIGLFGLYRTSLGDAQIFQLFLLLFFVYAICVELGWRHVKRYKFVLN